MRSDLPAKIPATTIPKSPPRAKMKPVLRFRVFVFWGDSAILETGARRISSAFGGVDSREDSEGESPMMRRRRKDMMSFVVRIGGLVGREEWGDRRESEDEQERTCGRLGHCLGGVLGESLYKQNALHPEAGLAT